MTPTVNGQRIAVLAGKAKPSPTDWLLARKEHRAKQLAANVEVRKLWAEADLIKDVAGGLRRVDQASIVAI